MLSMKLEIINNIIHDMKIIASPSHLNFSDKNLKEKL